jgi:hypothetical protein
MTAVATWGTGSERQAVLSARRVVEASVAVSASEGLAPVVPIGAESAPYVEPVPRLGFTREETAMAMGCSSATVDRLIRAKKLKPFRFGKVVLVTRQAMLDCLESGGDLA